MADILVDKPTTKDQLGFEPFRHALNEIITGAVETPFTIGIFGTWGSGKTSLMQMIEADLPKQRYRTVWFDAWKFAQQDVLWRALLLRVLRALKPPEPEEGQKPADEMQAKRAAEARKDIEHLEQALYGDVAWTEKGQIAFDWREGLKGAAGTILSLVLATQPGFVKEVVDAARKGIGEGKPLGDSLGFLRAFSQETVEHHQAQLRSLEEFQDTFRRILTLTLSPDQRFVLFIDDLDRCLPEKAVEILEAVKLFLDVEGCIFVLGVDRVVIEQGICVRYKDFSAAGAMPIKGRDYLDKIIQLPFNLPPIYDADIAAYIQKTIPRRGRAVIRKAMSDSADIFAAGLEANPRKVKRALGAFHLLLTLAVHRERVAARHQQIITKIEPGLLAKLVVIQNSFPDLYEECVQRYRLLRDIEDDVLARGVEVAATEVPAGANINATLVERFRDRPALRKMLSLEPFFRDLPSLQTLQDHIYLTRSTRETTVVEAPVDSDIWRELTSGDPTRIQSVLEKALARRETYLARLRRLIGDPSAELSERSRACRALRWVAPGSIDLTSLQSELTQLLADASTSIGLRLAVGEVLGYIGDPRDFDEMIQVPGGDFLYGDNRQAAPVDLFYIGKYPVTNLQYKKFLDASPQYPVPLINEDWSRPYDWDKEKRTYPEGRANHPVVLVRWEDAQAYCKWLAEQTGKPFRLPREVEWEKAARGTEGQEYPWAGDFEPGKANTSESGVRGTTPVGIYPDGASPYGVLDCAGNVLEWTADEHGGGGIALRGGSWSGNQFEARCTARGKYFRGQSDNFIGFRVSY